MHRFLLILACCASFANLTLAQEQPAEVGRYVLHSGDLNLTFMLDTVTGMTWVFNPNKGGGWKPLPVGEGTTAWANQIAFTRCQEIEEKGAPFKANEVSYCAKRGYVLPTE